jgi:phosphatidylserine/phosphatidylglycerophosphate/cardiolipin synthase-like enzyme
VLKALLVLASSAASAPLLPPVPLGDGASITVCFAPRQDCAALAIAAIEAARRRILVSAYNLTTGSGIVEALIRAIDRGVEVDLIADKTTPCERRGGIEPLAAAGAAVWIDDRVRIAHAKSMVIDDRVTLMGSYNWSRNAARNSEDLNLIVSPGVAQAYRGQWEDRLGVATRFERREDWCRPRSRRKALDGGG